MLCSLYSLQAIETDTVTDADGNVYKTIKVGDYWWMTENLRTKHYNNGDSVAFFTGTVTSSTYDNASYCSYPNNDPANFEKGGLFYSWWAAMDSRGLCPSGWEVADTAAWYNLAQSIGIGSKIMSGTTDGGWTLVGKYLKADTSLWTSSTSASTIVDSLQFNAIPLGDFNTGGYLNYGTEARFWTANYAETAAKAGRRYMSLSYASDNLVRDQYRGVNNLSVRCVKKVSNSGIKNAVDLSTVVFVYPNPADDYICIETQEAGASWSIFDASGSHLLSGKMSSHIQSIPVSQLPQGLYFISISNTSYRKSLKFIKE